MITNKPKRHKEFGLWLRVQYTREFADAFRAAGQSLPFFLSFGRVARRPRCQSIHLLPEQKRNIGFDQNRRRRTSRFILRGRIRCSFFVVCFTWPSRRYIARNKESNRTERCVGARAAHPSGRGINGTAMVSRPCCHGANRFR